MAALIRITRYLEQKRGASLTGYGLIVGLIAIAAITAVTRVGTTVTELFGGVASSLGGSVSNDGDTGSGGDGGEEEEETGAEPNLLVTTALDETCSPCTSLEDEAGDGGGLSLREAIALVNAGVAGEDPVIGFDLSSPTIVLGSEGPMSFFSEGHDLVINGEGNNVTVSGNLSTQILTIGNGATAEIHNLTFAEGSASHGGAINLPGSGGTLTLNNVTIRDSVATVRGGGLAIGDFWSVQLVNSQIIDNIVGGGSGSRGGGISFSASNSGSLTIDAGSVISGNNITGSWPRYGGGIYVSGSSAQVVINGATISENGNVNGGYGAAIGIFDGAQVTINGGTISDNGNETYQASLAVFNSGSHLEVLNGTVISGNLSGSPGAAILANDSATVNVDDALITQNETQTDCGSGAYAAGGAEITITNSTITGNAAYCGAVASRDGATITLNNTSVTNNNNDAYGYSTCAGAMVTDPDSILIIENGSIISGNHAISYGGGVCSFFGGSAQITDSTITTNSAGGDGGGLYARWDTEVVLENTAITGNTGYRGGGIAAAEGASVTINGGTINNNTADAGAGGGGGVYASYGGGAYFDATTVTGDGLTTMSGNVSENVATDGSATVSISPYFPALIGLLAAGTLVLSGLAPLV